MKVVFGQRFSMKVVFDENFLMKLTTFILILMNRYLTAVER